MIKNLSNFLIEHNKYKNNEKIEEYLKEHNKFGTLDYAIEREEIVAMVRWNIRDNVAEVLDFCVRKDFRNKGLGKNFIIRAKYRFPSIEYIEFKRGVRGDNRVRKLEIKKILKKNIF